MIRDHFRILTVDLATGKGRIVTWQHCCLTNMATRTSLGTIRSSLSFSPSDHLPAISRS